MNIDIQKSELRKHFLGKRALLHKNESETSAAKLWTVYQQNLADHFAHLSSGSIIAGYIAIRSEIDPQALLTEFAERGFTIALPVVIGKDKPLLFRTYQHGDPLIKGSLGTLHPEQGKEVQPDVLFVPLLSFDKNCCRLGYGGGFYDRTLALYSGADAFGIAFDGQMSEQPLPRSAFDTPLTGVITPTCYYPNTA